MSTDTSAANGGAGTASALIDARIRELGDWRGQTLARVRALIHEAVPDVVEEWKWRGVPVWSHGGILCTGETYKAVVKLTFAKGASLADPAGLFNASLEGNTRRAIHIRESETIDGAAFRALMREAVAINASKASGAAKVAKGAKGTTSTKVVKVTKGAKASTTPTAATFPKPQKTSKVVKSPKAKAKP